MEPLRLAVFCCPPLTVEKTPLAVLASPPLTEEAAALAVLPGRRPRESMAPPPLTEDHGPLAVLRAPPLTEDQMSSFFTTNSFGPWPVSSLHGKYPLRASTL